MEIIKAKNENELSIALKGRLDTTTSPLLETELELDGISRLVFDFSELDYISSAGLRILLSSQKTMNKQGEMIIRNVNGDIMEVFEITGFCDILTIE